MFRKTVLVRALSVAFSTAALSAAVMSPAMAQSNAAGTIYGRVAPGSTVVLKNVDTNQTRTVTADGNGQFQASALAIGHYKATVMKSGTAAESAEVDVLAGQGVEAVFVAAGAVQSIEVSGRRSRIDVSSASNGATFTSKELAKLPVGKNVASIIQLAPNTTRSDPTYPAGASIGGGAATENAYYINGFPVTNALTQLGASELPFGAIAQAEISTGGFGAEFGRSVGGVVNITGKSGTNNWEIGALASTTPDKFRSKAKDQYYAQTPSSLSGKLRFLNSQNTTNSTQMGVYLGGPIVKDKLFMFAALEETDSEFGTVIGNAQSPAATNAKSGYSHQVTNLQRYYTKFDWNITDNHRLEFTAIGDLPRTDSETLGYDFTNHAIITPAKKSAVHTANNGANGGEDQILRYTGNLTDDFTVTALYGTSQATHIYEPLGYNANLFAVSAPANFQAPGLNYASSQTFSGAQAFSGAKDIAKFGRIDLEYKVSLGGMQNTFRGGIDNKKDQSLNAGTVSAGGGTWAYAKADNPNAPFSASGGGLVPALTPFGGIAAQGYYVTKVLSSTASNAYAGQSAQYIEDRMQVTKNLLLTFGLRDEQFYNANSDHVKYLEMKNQITPRFNAAWDVNGDSSFKIYGSAGRYTVQMPTVVALRGANGSLNTSQYFVYTGTDSNGIPTGLTQLTAPLSTNGEFGQAKDPHSIASTNLKPSYQDEITLGLEKSFSPSLNFGAKFTYRKLRSTIDDFCDGRPFRKYALDHNIAMPNDTDFDPSSPSYSFFNCASFNPGEAQDFLIDYAGTKNYTKVHLTAAEMGFPKAERTYTALDFFAEHPYRGGWYGKVNYTWSRSKGNTEGQTQSDFNTGQSDVAATTTWDYAEIMQYANGLLPNDRQHQIKAFGYYDLSPQWTIGANLLLSSGRPKGCVGQNPNPAAASNAEIVGYSPDYGVEHWCFGVATPGHAAYESNVPAPRGTLGRLPWTKNLDLNIVFKPAMMKDLSLKMDIFNVFNTQGVAKLNEQYNSGGGIASTYGAVNSYDPPRAIKLSAEYNHKF